MLPSAPGFTTTNIAFAFIGSAVFWGKWGRTELRAYILYDLLNMVDQILKMSKRTRAGIECLIFIAAGIYVGISLTEPTNPAQALAAGLGWTGLFATSKSGKV
jgi:hypothetical protein